MLSMAKMPMEPRNVVDKKLDAPQPLYHAANNTTVPAPCLTAGPVCPPAMS